MKTLCAFLVFLSSTSVHAADARRYVVAVKMFGEVKTDLPLWQDRFSANLCFNLRSKDPKASCEQKRSGLTYQLGTLRVGDEVELLDSRECGEIMSRVRVIKGKSAGELGCLTTDALSTIKP
jgi:hypothetical protein